MVQIKDTMLLDSLILIYGQSKLILIQRPGGIPWEQNFDLIWLFTLYLGETVPINKL